MTRTFAIALLLAGCTIDPIARAKLSGDASGDAIFQQSGTSEQVSYQVSLTGADDRYEVVLVADCAQSPAGADTLGVLDVAGGTGTLRAVTAKWEVATGGDDDVVGRSVMVARAGVAAGCGAVFNSD